MKNTLKQVNEARVDKHEISGYVVIDGHVFRDAGKSGRSTYGRYATKDPNYVKDPKEVGMHRNYRKPDTVSFSTINDAKKWVKTQPKKSKEEIDRVHQKFAEREKYMNEESPIHDEFKKAMGIGSYGDFVKKHGVSKTRTIVSSLKKERDDIRKKEWAGPQHIKHHDFAIHGLKRAIGEDVSMVGGSPANNVGGGDIAGLGIGPQGEPGVKKGQKKKVMPFAVFARKYPK